MFHTTNCEIYDKFNNIFARTNEILPIFSKKRHQHTTHRDRRSSIFVMQVHAHSQRCLRRFFEPEPNIICLSTPRIMIAAPKRSSTSNNLRVSGRLQQLCTTAVEQAVNVMNKTQILIMNMPHRFKVDSQTHASGQLWCGEFVSFRGCLGGVRCFSCLRDVEMVNDLQR